MESRADSHIHGGLGAASLTDGGVTVNNYATTRMEADKQDLKDSSKISNTSPSPSPDAAARNREQQNSEFMRDITSKASSKGQFNGQQSAKSNLKQKKKSNLDLQLKDSQPGSGKHVTTTVQQSILNDAISSPQASSPDKVTHRKGSFDDTESLKPEKKVKSRTKKVRDESPESPTLDMVEKER